MSSGRRNHRVLLQSRGTTQNSVGQILPEVWTTTATVWASISPLAGREYLNASGERAEVSHRIFIRYGPTVAPKDRVLFGSRVFDIISVINIRERNRELELMCTEVV